MDSRQYKYDAFISYRHCEPDMSIAKALHKQLEGFHIPSAVRKATGIKKMGKVFRDQEELPTSDDLGRQIEEALDQSKYLIVIATENLPTSKWCMREVDIFIELGRRDRILILLASGEPVDSFPPQLRVVNIDGVEIEKEPIAADVRAATTSQMIKNLKLEKLRILAAMLRVDFDDLRQRHREARMKTTAAVLASAAIFFAAFGGFTLYQSLQIRSQRDELLIGQSKTLAAQSIDLLKKGDVSGALLLSFEALPGENDAKPLTAEAQESLFSAMLFDRYDTFRPVAQLPQPVSAISPDGSAFITTGGGTSFTRLYDTSSLAVKKEYTGASGTVLTLSHPRLNISGGELNAPRFNASGDTFYLTNSQNGIYKSSDGESIQPGKLETAAQAADFGLSEYIVRRDDGFLNIYSVASGEIALTIEPNGTAIGAAFSGDGKYMFFADSAVSQVWSLESKQPLFTVDASNYEQYGTIGYNYVFSPDSKYVYETRLSVFEDTEGKTMTGVMVRKNYRMYETETGKEVFHYYFDEDYVNLNYNLLNEGSDRGGGASGFAEGSLQHRFSPDGKIFIQQTKTKGFLTAVDLATGRELYNITKPSQLAFVSFSPDSKTLLLCCSRMEFSVSNFGELYDLESGFVEIINASTGKVLETLYTDDLNPETARYAGDNVILVNGTDTKTSENCCRVFFREENALTTRLGTYDYQTTSIAVFNDGSGKLIIKDSAINARVMDGEGNALFALKDSTPYTIFATSPDGTVIAGASDTELALWSGATGAKERTLPLELAPRILAVSADLTRVGIIGPLNGSSFYQAIDTETGRVIGMGHVGTENCFALFDTAVRRVLFASLDSIGILNTDTMRPVFLIEEYSYDYILDTGSVAIAWNEEKDIIAVASEKSEDIGIHSGLTGEKLLSISSAGHAITSLSFSPDRESLLAASRDGYIAVYDVSSGEPLLSIDSGNVNTLNQTVFSTTGQYILTNCGVYSAQSGTLLLRYPSPENISIYASSADDNGVWIVEFFADKAWVKLHQIPEPDTLRDMAGGFVRGRAFTVGELSKYWR